MVDRIGRRKLLLSTGTLVGMLAVISALLSKPGQSPTGLNTGISFIYPFMEVFSFGQTPMYVIQFEKRGDPTRCRSFSRQALYPAEVLSYGARARALAFLTFVMQGVSCINAFGYYFSLPNNTFYPFTFHIVL